MDFVVNFIENTIVKKFKKNRSTFFKVKNECMVAQFLLRHGVVRQTQRKLHRHQTQTGVEPVVNLILMIMMSHKS